MGQTQANVMLYRGKLTWQAPAFQQVESTKVVFIPMLLLVEHNVSSND